MKEYPAYYTDVQISELIGEDVWYVRKNLMRMPIKWWWVEDYSENGSLTRRLAIPADVAVKILSVKVPYQWWHAKLYYIRRNWDKLFNKEETL